MESQEKVKTNSEQGIQLSDHSNNCICNQCKTEFILQDAKRYEQTAKRFGVFIFKLNETY